MISNQDWPRQWHQAHCVSVCRECCWLQPQILSRWGLVTSRNIAGISRDGRSHPETFKYIINILNYSIVMKVDTLQTIWSKVGILDYSLSHWTMQLLYVWLLSCYSRYWWNSSVELFLNLSLTRQLFLIVCIYYNSWVLRSALFISMHFRRPLITSIWNIFVIYLFRLGPFHIQKVPCKVLHPKSKLEVIKRLK